MHIYYRIYLYIKLQVQKTLGVPRKHKSIQTVLNTSVSMVKINQKLMTKSLHKGSILIKGELFIYFL